MQTRPPIITPHEWACCVAAVTEGKVTELATWRGWLRATCYLLRDQSVIGIYKDCWAFPNIDQDGDIRSIHYRIAPKNPNDKATWRHSLKGAGTHALVFGDPLKADAVGIHEGQWDAVSQIDKLSVNPFATSDWAIIATRGASNAKTLAEIDIAPSADIFVFPQNDEVGDRWSDAVIDIIGREVFVVSTPTGHKDLNDWGRNGLTPQILWENIKKGVPRQPVKERRSFTTKFCINWSCVHWIRFHRG